MMHGVWSLILLVGVCFACATGADATRTLLDAAQDAVSLCIRLAGGFAFWSGMIAILEEGGALKGLARALKVPFAWLFPGVAPDGEAGQAMVTNLAANMLGLGNAATPMGLAAMRQLGEQTRGDAATDAMCMFLVINASSIQLFPSSVIALRAASGSVASASIVLPTLVATAVSTLVGVAVCRLLARRKEYA